MGFEERFSILELRREDEDSFVAWAVDEVQQRTVLVRRLSEKRRHDPSGRAKLAAEAEYTARLNCSRCPNAKIIDLEDGERVLLYDHGDGVGLDRLIQSLEAGGRALTPAAAVFVVSEVLHAACAIQAVRPANVGAEGVWGLGEISPDTIVVGVDGVARLFDARFAATGLRAGSSPFGATSMRPERAMRHGSPAGDAYAVGTLLAACVLGPTRLLQDEITDLGKLVEHELAGADIPEGFRFVLGTALASSPTERFESAAVMRLALRQCSWIEPAVWNKVKGGLSVIVSSLVQNRLMAELPDTVLAAYPEVTMPLPVPQADAFPMDFDEPVELTPLVTFTTSRPAVPHPRASSAMIGIPSSRPAPAQVSLQSQPPSRQAPPRAQTQQPRVPQPRPGTLRQPPVQARGVPAIEDAESEAPTQDIYPDEEAAMRAALAVRREPDPYAGQVLDPARDRPRRPDASMITAEYPAALGDPWAASTGEQKIPGRAQPPRGPSRVQQPPPRGQTGVRPAPGQGPQNGGARTQAPPQDFASLRSLPSDPAPIPLVTRTTPSAGMPKPRGEATGAPDSPIPLVTRAQPSQPPPPAEKAPAAPEPAPPPLRTAQPRGGSMQASPGHMQALAQAALAQVKAEAEVAPAEQAPPAAVVDETGPASDKAAEWAAVGAPAVAKTPSVPPPRKTPAPEAKRPSVPPLPITADGRAVTETPPKPATDDSPTAPGGHQAAPSADKAPTVEQKKPEEAPPRESPGFGDEDPNKTPAAGTEARSPLLVRPSDSPHAAITLDVPSPLLAAQKAFAHADTLEAAERGKVNASDPALEKGAATDTGEVRKADVTAPTPPAVAAKAIAASMEPTPAGMPAVDAPRSISESELPVTPVMTRAPVDPVTTKKVEPVRKVRSSRLALTVAALIVLGVLAAAVARWDRSIRDRMGSRTSEGELVPAPDPVARGQEPSHGPRVSPPVDINVRPNAPLFRNPEPRIGPDPAAPGAAPGGESVAPGSAAGAPGGASGGPAGGSVAPGGALGAPGGGSAAQGARGPGSGPGTPGSATAPGVAPGSATAPGAATAPRGTPGPGGALGAGTAPAGVPGSAIAPGGAPGSAAAPIGAGSTPGSAAAPGGAPGAATTVGAAATARGAPGAGAPGAAGATGVAPGAAAAPRGAAKGGAKRGPAEEDGKGHAPPETIRFSWGGGPDAPAPPASPMAGRVRINVDPPGRISIDGADRGEPPLIIEGLKAGLHKIRITRQGYEPIEAEVVLRADEPRTLDFKLRETGKAP